MKIKYCDCLSSCLWQSCCAFEFLCTVAGRTIDVDGEPYSLQTEVALLTRNIKIIGQEYEDQEKDGFGARVIVSRFADKDNELHIG